MCAASQDAEEAFKKTVEVDRLIDTLRDANPKEVSRPFSLVHKLWIALLAVLLYDRLAIILDLLSKWVNSARLL